MAFVETPATSLADNQNTISAATANIWKRDIARAIDGTGGSDGVPYTPSTTIAVQGQGLEFVVKSGKTITLDSGSTVARSGKETLTGSGATTAWRRTNATNADETHDVSSDFVRIPATLSTLRLYTLRSSTSPIPNDGNVIRFWRMGSSYSNNARIRREDGTILATLGNSGNSSCAAMWDGSAWYIVESGGDIIVANVA